MTNSLPLEGIDFACDMNRGYSWRHSLNIIRSESSCAGKGKVVLYVDKEGVAITVEGRTPSRLHHFFFFADSMLTFGAPILRDNKTFAAYEVKIDDLHNACHSVSRNGGVRLYMETTEKGDKKLNVSVYNNTNSMTHPTVKIECEEYTGYFLKPPKINKADALKIPCSDFSNIFTTAQRIKATTVKIIFGPTYCDMHSYKKNGAMVAEKRFEMDNNATQSLYQEQGGDALAKWVNKRCAESKVKSRAGQLRVEVPQRNFDILSPTIKLFSKIQPLASKGSPVFLYLHEGAIGSAADNMSIFANIGGDVGEYTCSISCMKDANP